MWATLLLIYIAFGYRSFWRVLLEANYPYRRDSIVFCALFELFFAPLLLLLGIVLYLFQLTLLELLARSRIYTKEERRQLLIKGWM